MLRTLLISATLLVWAGCMTAAPPVALHQSVPEPDPDAFSLFSMDGAGLDDAMVTRLLGARVEIPDGARIAVLQAPSRSRYRYFGVTEEEVGAREASLAALRAELLPAGVDEVEVLPSLLVPERPSVPVLREVAVRLQADALLVFRVSGDVYQNYRLFRGDEFKTYATCEAVLLDVRTGALPFTTVVTETYRTEKQDGDISGADAQRRAQQQAVSLAMASMGREVAAFLAER